MLKKFVILGYCVAVFLSAAEAERFIARIDFADASVLDVVETLAQRAGLNLVISGNASLAQGKRTSLHLKNTTAQEAVEYVLKTNGMVYEIKDKTILVSALPSTQNYEGETESMDLKFLLAEKVSSLLAKIMPGIKSSVGMRANSIILQGGGSVIKEAKELIYSIDKPVPQVLIESKVLEISESNSMRLGFSFGQEAGVFKFITDKDDGRTAPAADLVTTLNSLITDGKANVVASPKIATLDNHEAIINIGSRIPYAVPVTSGSNTTQWTVDYIDAGVKLKITPCLGEDGYIVTSIQPEVSSVSEWRTTSAGEFPVITTRNAQATLSVKDGETIVVGGLLSESERENVSRLPVLGYLPILGLFFQNRTIEKAKTEIMFLITPHII